MSVKFLYKDSDLFCHRTIDLHPDDNDFNMHAHDGFEILYFISGNCKCMIEGTEYRLQPHDILIMRPAETHKLKVLGSEPYERMAIRFSSNLLKSVDETDVLQRPFFERDLGKLNLYRKDMFPSEIHTLCLDTLEEKASVNKKKEITCRLYLLLCEIYKAYGIRKDKRQTAVVEDMSVSIVDYINKNLFEDLSLASISQEFYMSQSQINRIFRKATGSSVWEYIIIKRLLTARNSIKEGKSVGKVCSSCGFKDYSSFYRIYKKHFGCSPREDAKNESEREEFENEHS